MSYFDVYDQLGDKPAFCYRSGLMVYEEQLFCGALVSAGWNTAGYPLDVNTSLPTRLNPRDFAEPFAFDLEINGQSVAYDLKFVDFSTEKTEAHIHAVLTLESGRMDLLIKIHTLLDGTQMLTRWLELENRSKEPMHISRISLLGGGLETKDDSIVLSQYSLGCFEKDEWGAEGLFSWKPLAEGYTTVERGFRRDRHRHPLIFLKNETTGALWFAQIAWSGGCRFCLDLKRFHNRTHLALSAELCGYAPLLVLEAGERFSLPEVHIGAVQGDLDMAVQQMHSHIRRSVLSLPADCLVGAGMGAAHDMSVKTSKAFIDQFASMGAEVFIIDAGWECPPHMEQQWYDYNGVNYPNPERYPNGLEELSDYCHEKGMKFGLWVEMERIGRCSEVYEKHPEWRRRNVFGERDREYLDLSIPEAAKWAEEELARIIRDYKLELLRVDYNGGQMGYYGLRDRAGGAKECMTLRHFQAVYQIYGNLKKRFPQVVFENCAGGGGRCDLAIMKNFDHTWVSDWQMVPRSAAITNGMTMALPPERVDRLFAGMGCHEIGGLDAHMRNCMLGHITLNVVHSAAAEDNAEQLAFIRHSIQLYKDFIRPMLPSSRIYHHTPDSHRGLFQLLEIAAPDGSKGALTAITHCNAGDRQIKVRLRGARSDKKYKVTFDNEAVSLTLDGYKLHREGIELSVPAALSSELILYEEA